MATTTSLKSREKKKKLEGNWNPVSSNPDSSIGPRNSSFTGSSAKKKKKNKNKRKSDVAKNHTKSFPEVSSVSGAGSDPTDLKLSPIEYVATKKNKDNSGKSDSRSSVENGDSVTNSVPSLPTKNKRKRRKSSVSACESSNNGYANGSADSFDEKKSPIKSKKKRKKKKKENGDSIQCVEQNADVPETSGISDEENTKKSCKELVEEPSDPSQRPAEIDDKSLTSNISRRDRNSKIQRIQA
uniref:Uncharacterized protein n=1 Tax=Lygus hesperus TaxID=30085 RepID=A0A0K8SXS4_LYGHE